MEGVVLFVDFDNTLTKEDSYKTVLTDEVKRKIREFITSLDILEIKKAIKEVDTPVLNKWFIHLQQEKVIDFDELEKICKKVPMADGLDDFVYGLKKKYNIEIHVITQSFAQMAVNARVFATSISGSTVKKSGTHEVYEIKDILLPKDKPRVVNIIMQDYIKRHKGETPHVFALGDGETDIPMFEYVRSHGGRAILVDMKNAGEVSQDVYDIKLPQDFKGKILEYILKEVTAQ